MSILVSSLRIQFAVRSSVLLGISGLGLAALAYVVDKGFYGN